MATAESPDTLCLWLARIGTVVPLEQALQLEPTIRTEVHFEILLLKKHFANYV